MLPLILLLVCGQGICWAADSAAGPTDGRVIVRRAARMAQAGYPDQAEALLRRLLTADPGQAVAHQTLGALALVQGRLDSAEAHYARAAAIDSCLPEAWHGLGLVRAARGDHPGADAAYQLALNLDAGQPVFFYNAGLSLERRGMFNDAGMAFETALRIAPDNADARRHLGAVLRRTDRPQEALVQYAHACRLAPRHPANWLGLAGVHAALYQDSLAAEARLQAARLGVGRSERSADSARPGEPADSTLSVPARGSSPEAPALPLELGLTGLDLATGQYELGLLYGRGGRPAEAAARFQRAADLGLAVTGPPPAVDPADRAGVETRAALEALRAQDYRLAAGRYAVAARLLPQVALIHRNLGLALATLGRPAPAIAAYEQALRLDSCLAQGYNDLGLVYSQSYEDHERAIGLLRRAVALDPAAKLYHFNLAQVHLGIGQWVQAAAELERVIEFDPQSALAQFCLGVAQARQGLAGAEAHLLQALAINPEYADAWYELGRLYTAAGRTADAAAMYERCIACRPQHKYAHYGLGQAYAKLGRADEARPLLERFATLPAHPKQQQFIFFAPPDSL
ncbi:MAG: tetratricopeptide repeat protein [Candidatus Latescibacterota bacterium]